MNARWLWLILLVCLLPMRAEAHKVILFAYVEGDRVHTESYFVDGTPCVSGSIRVENAQGELLLEGETDAEGIFEFDLPAQEDLHLVLDASMGHRAEYLLSSSEIDGQIASQPAASLPSSENEPRKTRKVASFSPVVVSNQRADMRDPSQESLEQLIDRKLAPLVASVEALRRSQERARWTDVIGGLGYILGLMGLVVYFRSRKEKG